jgi:PAS domain-containing protein
MRHIPGKMVSAAEARRFAWQMSCACALILSLLSFVAIAVRPMMAPASGQGEYKCLRCPIVRGSGEVQYARCSATLLRDRFGAPVPLFGTMLDVIEREKAVRAWQALQESDERFRSAVKHSAVGMAILGTEGRFLKVNCAMCEMLGRTKEQMLVYTFQDTTHPEDLGANVAGVRALLVGDVNHYQIRKAVLSPDWPERLGPGHRDPDSQQREHITVAWKRLPEREVVLRVSDDGTGLPTELEHGKEKSLGLRLVRTLVRPVRGERRVSGGDMTVIEIISGTDGV